MDPNDQHLMRLAIQLARASVRAGGGPFGCVIARDGRPIAEGQNRVTLANDPTAHAEVVAIRAACTSLGSFQLDRCTVYASCEPCPMCLGAIYWARAQRLVYACTRADAAAIGFDDDHIYREIARAPAARELQTGSLLRDEALAAFRDWSSAPDRREY